MELFKNRARVTSALLVAIILLLVIQNFFLVKKVDQHLQTIGQLTDRLNSLSFLREGDTVYPFYAMTMDSTVIPVDPMIKDSMKIMLAFSTRCGACIKNLDHWREIVRPAQGSRSKIFGICPDSISQMRRYGNTFSLPFTCYSILEDSTISIRCKLFSYPQTIVIDTNGLVRGIWVGVLDKKKEAEVVAALMGEMSR